MDALGHVNNTACFRWFESVRIGYFARIGWAADLSCAEPLEREPGVARSCMMRGAATGSHRQLEETLDVLSDPDALADIREADAAYAW